MKNFFDIKNKNVFITGGGTGIGLAVVKRFIKAGANVFFVNRSDRTSIANKIGAGFCICDVSDEKNYIEALEKAKTFFKGKKLDVIISNAGITGGEEEMVDVEVKTFKDVMEINLHGTLFGFKHGSKYIKDGGSYIITSSEVINLKLPGYEPYSCSKAAVDSISKTAAIELSHRNIRVNMVSPSTTRTDMQPDDDMEGIMVKYFCPYGKMSTVDDLVGLYHFLASDESSFINGQSIAVDGGWSVGINKRLAEKLTS